jgi:hypothetical protein
VSGWARVALVAFAACSSNALSPDASGPATDGGPPETGAEAAGDRTEGGGRCGQTSDRATVAVLAPGNELLGCEAGASDGGPVPARTWAGQVTGSDATTLVVDVCGGDGGCDPLGLRIEVRAPGIDLRGFPHVPVQVTASFRRFFGCQQALHITTVTGQLLLAVVDGGGPAGAPYSVDRVRLGCSSEKGCGSVPPDDYALDFSSEAAPAPLRVYMGETVPWTLGGRAHRVRNLRSFQSTACDDYWNFAYTISLAP